MNFFDDAQLGAPRAKKKFLDKDKLIAVKRQKRTFDYLQKEEFYSKTGDVLVLDAESYFNVFMVSVKCVKTGKVYCFKDTPEESIDIDLLMRAMYHCLTIGFNSNSYDLTVISAACAGYRAPDLKEMTRLLIEEKMKPVEIAQKYKFQILKNINHIDLIEVCPLSASLKIYGGRLNCLRMQDLPFEINKHLTKEETYEVEQYNYNDLDLTALIAMELKEQLELRVSLSQKYEIDLRSKSDAQIAEAVITNEIYKITGKFPRRPSLPFDYTCRYKAPEFVQFKTEFLSNLLTALESLEFKLDKGGSPMMPLIESGPFKNSNYFDEFDTSVKSKKDKKKALKILINKTTYTVGMGGLHSNEKNSAHKSDDIYILLDRDVASYYPNIILICKLFPKHIGEAFLNVYRTLVNMRLTAKGLSNSKELTVAEHNQVIADSLKIVINGSFGKLGSKWSALYSPDLMLQVTITGQLCLLLLIESIELAGIEVVSANTDGIVIKCPRDRKNELDNLIKQWEKQTGFETEEAIYKALYSKDVNNYIAVKENNKCKLKGAYSNHWNGDKKTAIFRFHKNPTTLICIDAVTNFITTGAAIAKTITECKDVTKFITVRSVKGGGHKNGVYLGKAVRWYYGKGEKEAIYYIGSGNKVAKSDGAIPMMDLTETIPDDIDYEWYINEANSMLFDIGYHQRKEISFF